MTVKTRVLLTLFLLLLTAGVVIAQPNMQPTDPKRESPRATLRTFMDAFAQPRLGVTPDPIDEAIKCIDLEAIPADYRSIRGFEVAAQLYEVIHSIENFHLEDVPAENKGEPFHLFRSTHGEIVLTRHPNGEWLFAQETARVAPLLIADIEEERRTHGSATLAVSDSVGSQIRERMPPILRPRTLGLERWQWLGLIVIGLLGLLVWQIVRFTASLILGRLLRSRFGEVADEHVTGLYQPVGLIAFVITFRLGLRALSLTPGPLATLRSAMFVLMAIGVIWLIYRIVDIAIAKLRKRAYATESNYDNLLVPFIGAIVRLAVVIIGLILVAENLDFNVTGLIAGLGIGGIAIALASQETLSNFFGSLVLLIEQPFKAEDRVEVDGVKGTVKEVGFRSTRILTYDNSLITVPNATIAKAHITNIGTRRRRTWLVDLGVPYSNRAEKVEKLCAGIADIIGKSESLDNEEFKVSLFEIKPPSLTLRIIVAFKEDDFAYETDARHAFILDVLKLADELEIELEVPN
ncbi:MAG: mechanosensitive ion channel domain-containing protein [Pyrinomonadaceae bacterium]